MSDITFDLTTEEGRAAYTRHWRATVPFQYRMIGYGPDHVAAFRSAIAAELSIDGERLAFTQTHPFGFDIALDGAALELTHDQMDGVWRRLVEAGAVRTSAPDSSACPCCGLPWDGVERQEWEPDGGEVGAPCLTCGAAPTETLDKARRFMRALFVSAEPYGIRGTP